MTPTNLSYSKYSIEKDYGALSIGAIHPITYRLYITYVSWLLSLWSI